VFHSYVNYTTPILMSDALNKYNNGDPFIYLIYSEGCHVCETLLPFFVRYVKEYEYQIYSTNYNDDTSINESEKTEIVSTFKDKSIEEPRVPDLYIFKEGTVIYNNNEWFTNQLNYNYIKKVFNTFVK
ncbi:MAG: hypothetical protein HUJ61_08650, partial [Bacilli bacterium]|nr:hypothetical protein [Bacilli bacterium]